MVVECNLPELVGHLIHEQVHSGQSGVRVLARPPPRLLCSLLITVGPVEDLILQKLALSQCTEGCAREEKVVRNGEVEDLRESVWESVGASDGLART